MLWKQHNDDIWTTTIDKSPRQTAHWIDIGKKWARNETGSNAVDAISSAGGHSMSPDNIARSSVGRPAATVLIGKILFLPKVFVCVYYISNKPSAGASTAEYLSAGHIKRYKYEQQPSMARHWHGNIICHVQCSNAPHGLLGRHERPCTKTSRRCDEFQTGVKFLH